MKESEKVIHIRDVHWMTEPEEIKTAIIKTGEKIKTGLNNCRIEKKVNVDRCYRCWGYGHKEDGCRATSRTEYCQMSQMGKIQTIPTVL